MADHFILRAMHHMEDVFEQYAAPKKYDLILRPEDRDKVFYENAKNILKI